MRLLALEYACRTGLALFLAVTSGCYAAYPHGSKRAVPPTASAGARLEIRPKNHTEWRTCGDDISECEMHLGRLEHPTRYVRYYTYYDGKEITLGQYQALTDPTYGKRWDQIESKKGMCKLSIPPTALYFAGALASVVGFTLGATKKDGTDTEKLLAYGGAGVMVFGAALSYPMGGYACRAAGKIGDDLEVTYAEGTYEVNNGPADERKLARMQAAIAAFNAGGGVRTADASTEPPTEDTPPTETATETPDPTPKKPRSRPRPPEPTPDSALAEVVIPKSNQNVVETLRAAKKFSIFLRALEESKVGKLLADAGPYTVFAPTDEAFAKLSKAELAAWFADKKQLAEEVKGYVVPESLPSEILKTKIGLRYKTLRGPNSLYVELGSSSFRVEDGLGTGPETRCTNGVIYAIDTVTKPSR